MKFSKCYLKKEHQRKCNYFLYAFIIFIIIGIAAENGPPVANILSGYGMFGSILGLFSFGTYYLIIEKKPKFILTFAFIADLMLLYIIVSSIILQILPNKA